jgi:hypothetical protein
MAHFEVKEFDGAELAGPFDFTKGVKLLKLNARADAKRPPGQDGTGLADAVTALYDLETDPRQQTPITDAGVIERLKGVIVRELARHDTPAEVYTHFGLDAPGTLGSRKRTAG